jgi:hypothetical protein
MVHSLFIGGLYVAMVLTPCVVAMFARADGPENTQ